MCFALFDQRNHPMVNSSPAFLFPSLMLARPGRQASFGPRWFHIQNGCRPASNPGLRQSTIRRCGHRDGPIPGTLPVCRLCFHWPAMPDPNGRQFTVTASFGHNPSDMPVINTGDMRVQLTILLLVAATSVGADQQQISPQLPAQVRAELNRLWDPLESTCRHASLSIL